MTNKPVFPILGVFRLKGQPKRDGGIIVRSCKASQSPVYPILFSRIERVTVMTALELRNVAVKVLAAGRGIEPRSWIRGSIPSGAVQTLKTP